MPDRRVHDVEQDGRSVCFYTVMFQSGFRLPLPPFLCQLMHFYWLSHVQLVANSWRFLVSYLCLCKYKDWEPSIAVVRNLWVLKRTGGWYYLQSRTSDGPFIVPSSNKSWKNKFVEVVVPKGTEWGFPTEWRDTEVSVVNNSGIYLSDSDREQVDYLHNHRRAFRSDELIQSARLILCRLSPFPVEGTTLDACNYLYLDGKHVIANEWGMAGRHLINFADALQGDVENEEEEEEEENDEEESDSDNQGGEADQHGVDDQE